MKLSIRRITALVAAILLVSLCPLAALAEGAATAAPQATEAPTEKPKVSAEQLQSQGILSVGAKGEEVSRLQQRLKDLGYLDSKVDGKFGGGTKRAVIAFQRRNKLTTDGEAGEATLALLYSDKAEPYERHQNE